MKESKLVSVKTIGSQEFNIFKYELRNENISLTK